jgi:NAD(P)-dependent dehydrogenase (short-subunit alcohol dehydrogenase family)
MARVMTEAKGGGALRDRVILVTGAGQGIGRAAAICFAQHGATVALHGRSVIKLESVYDEIVAAGAPQPAIIPLDLEKAGDRDFENLADSIHTRLGRLDGILHNAALGAIPSPLRTHTTAQWLSLLRVNLVAPFALTRACLPLLEAAPDAAIVLISETHGPAPAAFWGAFSIAKGALLSLATIWTQELEHAPQLRINVLVPGPVNSPQRSRTHPGEEKAGLRMPESLMSTYLYWIGPESRGQSGNLVQC